MKKTGGILVLLQNKKLILLLLKGLNNIESTGIFHGVNEETFSQFGLIKNFS